MNRNAPIIAATLAVLLLLFAAYMGSYYALLEGDVLITLGDVYEVRRNPTYRVDGLWLERTLWPANQIDRLVRPNYWIVEPLPTPLVGEP